MITHFLKTCYRYFSFSPLYKGGWGGRSVASEKEIGINSGWGNSGARKHALGVAVTHPMPVIPIGIDALRFDASILQTVVRSHSQAILAHKKR